MGFTGYVYLITNLTNNRKYFGKKTLTFSRSKKVKGSTRRKHTTKESDWKTYWGSSKELVEDVKALGEDSFRREILRFCKSKSEANYFEAKYQFEHDVLLYPEQFYNGHIMVRVHGSTLKNVSPA